MSTDNKINPNDHAVNASEAAKKATNTLRANLSMNAEDETVGSGLMAVHMDRGLMKQLKKDQKKTRKDKAFNGMLASVEAQMAEINAQINWHAKEIAKIDKELDTLKTDKARLERGELPEKGADGKYSSATEKAIKEWEKKNGKKLDRNDPDIILAAILEREAILRAARTEHEIKKEGLEGKIETLKEMKESGNVAAYQEKLEAESADVFMSVDDVKDAEIVADVSEEFISQRNQVVAEHEMGASADIEDGSFGDFFEDELSPSIPKSLIVAEFSQSASGQIQAIEPTVIIEGDLSKEKDFTLNT